MRRRIPLPVEEMGPSSVFLPISVSGFDEFALQYLAALVEKPISCIVNILSPVYSTYEQQAESIK